MAIQSTSSFKNSGRETKSLAASFTLGPYSIKHCSMFAVVLKFSSTGTFDAVGTVAVKLGESSDALSTVAFEDEDGDTQTSYAVSSSVDGTRVSLDGIVTAEENVWVVYTSTSGGTDDSVEVIVKKK